MSKTVIPPQAYTRDMLAEAYEWLKTQPPYIRENAENADSLVYMYLRAKRHGEQTVQNHYSESLTDVAPVSAAHFKSDLKDLAEGLKSFEFANEAPIQAPPQAPNTPVAQETVNVTPQQTTHTTTVFEEPKVKPEVSRPFQARMTERVVEVSDPGSAEPSPQLDQMSLSIVEKVQNGLNLSSQNEAIRVLISVGYEQIKKILPESKNS